MSPAIPSPAPLALRCHPECADAAVRAITVTPRREADGALALVWQLDGDPAALRIPDATLILPPERLWAHTCVELFVATAGGPAYREFNFSPNGQWMRFDFSAYRQRIASPAGPAPRIDTRCGEGGLAMRVHVPSDQLPSGELTVALTAVVEHADGSHTYWALRHPAGRPDFHHRDGFALALKASSP